GASKLAFSVQPNASYTADASIAAEVTIQDAFSNTVNDGPNAGDTISLGLSGGSSGASLTSDSSTSKAATNGVAGFSDLHVRKVGSGYQLTAADTGLTGASSTSFNITHGDATHIVFTGQPNASYTAAQTISVTVQVQDAWNNLVNDLAGSGATISLSLSGGDTTATLGATGTGNSTSEVATGGIATFNG